MTLAATAPDWSRNSGNSGLRWWVLVLAAIAVSSSYYEDDVIGPIADLLHRQRGFTQSQLGMLNGVIRIPNVALALISGLMIDRYGPARIALWAAAIGPLTFMVLGLTDLSLWVSTVMMGISFSLVPAVIWPATTLIVEPRRLGTALGLITLIQALGMAASNLAAGWLADKAAAGAQNPAGYTVMLWFFFLLSLTALSSAVLLWRRETGPGGHGLEVARPIAAAAA